MPARWDRAPTPRAVRSACRPSLSVQIRALSCPQSMQPSVVLRLVFSGYFAASACGSSALTTFILDDRGSEEGVTSGQSRLVISSEHFRFPQNLLRQTCECDLAHALQGNPFAFNAGGCGGVPDPDGVVRHCDRMPQSE